MEESWVLFEPVFNAVLFEPVSIIFLYLLLLIYILYLLNNYYECKIVESLLMGINFFRNELENLKVISCTDKKCAWNAPKKSALQRYDMNFLMTYHCLANKIELSQ